eukprot:366454-Chlamydomonas_euryale.AAC.11
MHTHLDDVVLAKLALDSGLLSAERHHIVPALDELLGDELADVASRPNHKHAHVLGCLGTEVGAHGCATGHATGA